VLSQDISLYEFSVYLISIFKMYLLCWGPRWYSCLWHCATRRKFAGSFPDGVIGSSYWLNPSGRNIALGSTRPLTEMSIRNISLG